MYEYKEKITSFVKKIFNHIKPSSNVVKDIEDIKYHNCENNKFVIVSWQNFYKNSKKKTRIMDTT